MCPDAAGNKDVYVISASIVSGRMLIVSITGISTLARIRTTRPLDAQTKQSMHTLELRPTLRQRRIYIRMGSKPLYIPFDQSAVL